MMKISIYRCVQWSQRAVRTHKMYYVHLGTGQTIFNKKKRKNQAREFFYYDLCTLAHFMVSCLFVRIKNIFTDGLWKKVRRHNFVAHEFFNMWQYIKLFGQCCEVELYHWIRKLLWLMCLFLGWLLCLMSIVVYRSDKHYVYNVFFVWSRLPCPKRCMPNYKVKCKCPRKKHPFS